MIWVNRLFRFYINSSIHVAFSVCALTVITLTKFNLPHNDTSLYFNFCATILGYNFVKFSPLFLRNELKFSSFFFMLLLVNITAFIGVIFFGYYLKLEVLKLILIFLLITFLYAFPTFKKKIKKST